jgi:hypothetical protein
MQNHLLKYKNWLSESETPEVYALTQEDIDYIQDNCKVLSVLKKSDLSEGISKHSNRYDYFYVKISTKDLEKYFNLLEKTEIEFVPSYFEETENIRIDFSRDNKLESGKHTSDILDSGSLSNRGKLREFKIKWNIDSRDQMLDIVNKSLDEIIKEIKKVRVMIQVGRKNIPDSLKPVMKKRILENYRNVVDSFFYEGKLPELGETNIGWIIAEIYASDKTILNTISDIEDKETLDSIIRSLEKMDETDVVKIIKAYVRTSRILKEI